MSATGVASRKKTSNLDNLTLSRKEGWREYVEAPRRIRPEELSEARSAVSAMQQPTSTISDEPTGTTTLAR